MIDSCRLFLFRQYFLDRHMQSVKKCTRPGRKFMASLDLGRHEARKYLNFRRCFYGGLYTRPLIDIALQAYLDKSWAFAHKCAVLEQIVQEALGG